VRPDEIQRDVLPIPDIPPAGFTGDVNWVELDVGLDGHNHMLAPEDRVNLAMCLQ
jgi:arylsulfatase